MDIKENIKEKEKEIVPVKVVQILTHEIDENYDDDDDDVDNDDSTVRSPSTFSPLIKASISSNNQNNNNNNNSSNNASLTGKYN